MFLREHQFLLGTSTSSDTNKFIINILKTEVWKVL
jgi:hypothetical protein